MDLPGSCERRAQPKRWQYSLFSVLVIFSLIAASLAISRVVHPLWVILFFAYALLAYCFSRPVVLQRLWLPLVFAAMHTILITIASAIQYASAWDDMSPTMLVTIAVYFLDYPIHFTFWWLGVLPGYKLWYFAQLVVTGGLLWFGVGLLVTTLRSLVAMLISNSK